MSKYLLFSRAATGNSFLKLVREKSAPSRADPVNDSESDSDTDEFEEEERKDKETIAPKTKIASRPRRKNCKELVDLWTRPLILQIRQELPLLVHTRQSAIAG